MFANKNGIFIQSLAAIIGNISQVGFGSIVGWLLTTSVHLQSSKTESHLSVEPLTDHELSWVLSAIFLSGLVGNVFISWMADGFGKKHTLCTITLSLFGSWFLYMFATNATDMYISGVLAGFSGGGSMIIMPLFIADISEDRIRGILGSTTMLSYHLGMFLSFIAQCFLTEKQATYGLICIPFLFLMGFMFFPDTPIQLRKEYRKEKAIHSLEFYRGCKSIEQQNTEYYKNELKKFQNTICDDDLTITNFANRSARRSLLMGIILFLIQQLVVIFIFLTYSRHFEIGFANTLTPTVQAVIIGGIQLFGTIISLCFVERIGRRWLLLISIFGTAITISMVGISLVFSSINNEWTVCSSFLVMVFCASIGLIPLPCVIVTEIIPEKIRTFSTTICTSFGWLLAFLLVEFCVLFSINLIVFIFVIGGACFLIGVFVFVYLPETKGRTYDEILLLMER